MKETCLYFELLLIDGYLLEYFQKLCMTSTVSAASDVNKDGKIDALDFAELRRFLLGMRGDFGTITV